MAIGKGAIKLAIIISAAVVIVALVVVSYLSGSEVNFEVAMQALGMFVAGILTALGLRRGGPVAGLALLVCAGSLGCGAPLHYARTSLDVAESAMNEVSDLIPRDAENRDAALDMVDSAFELGDRALDVWETGRLDDPPALWKKALVAILQGIDFVVEIIELAGVELPETIQEIREDIQMLSRFL